MATVAEVARSLLASTTSEAGLVLATRWIGERFAELAGSHRFKSLRQVDEFTVPTIISAGTITTNQGSQTVTANVAAQAAWANQDLTGRFFKADDYLYEIDALTTATTLRLRSEYVESNVAAGTYEIFKRFHKLNPDARWIGTMTLDRRALDRVSFATLDYNAPGRRTDRSRPVLFSEAGNAADGSKQVEVYPLPDTEAVLVRYVFWPEPKLLKQSDSVPGFIDPAVLKEGSLVDLYQWEMTKAIRSGEVEQSAVWRNEARAQRTTWERAKRDAYRADRGSDDVELILAHGRSSADRDITTAYDEVVTRHAL